MSQDSLDIPSKTQVLCHQKMSFLSRLKFQVLSHQSNHITPLQMSNPLNPSSYGLWIICFWHDIGIVQLYGFAILFLNAEFSNLFLSGFSTRCSHVVFSREYLFLSVWPRQLKISPTGCHGSSFFLFGCTHGTEDFFHSSWHATCQIQPETHQGLANIWSGFLKRYIESHLLKLYVGLYLNHFCQMFRIAHNLSAVPETISEPFDAMWLSQLDSFCFTLCHLASCQLQANAKTHQVSNWQVPWDRTPSRKVSSKQMQRHTRSLIERWHEIEHLGTKWAPSKRKDTQGL